MEFKVDKLGEVTVVRVAGNLDTQASPDAQKQLTQLIDNGAGKILIDFEDLNYIASSGLRMLLVAAKRLKGVSGQLRVCGLNTVVQEVFDISGFAVMLAVSKSQAEALDGF